MSAIMNGGGHRIIVVVHIGGSEVSIVINQKVPTPSRREDRAGSEEFLFCWSLPNTTYFKVSSHAIGAF